MYFSLCSCSASKSATTASQISCSSWRVKSFRSTSTWSLRERPLCIFLPVSPRRRVSMSSTCECTSSTPSSMTKLPSSMVLYILRSSLCRQVISSFVSMPMLCSIALCAIEPKTSYGASMRSSSLSRPTVKRSISGFTSMFFSQSFFAIVIILNGFPMCAHIGNAQFVHKACVLPLSVCDERQCLGNLFNSFGQGLVNHFAQHKVHFGLYHHAHLGCLLAVGDNLYPHVHGDG